jgi:hypothetical protein
MRPLCLVLAFIALTASVAAIGIAPAITELPYLPEQNLSIRVYGEGTVMLELNGSLAPYISLDKEVLVFSDVAMQTVTATVRLPPGLQSLTADVTAVGDTRVSARITIAQEAIPTGWVVSEQDAGNSHWVSLALILLVLGNVVYFTVSRGKRKAALDLKRIKTIAELASTARSMSDGVFRNLVNEDKNEFADWCGEHDFPELAYRLYDVIDRRATVKVLESYEPMQSGPEQEILELKRELDTFDFSSFDKIYK